MKPAGFIVEERSYRKRSEANTKVTQANKRGHEAGESDTVLVALFLAVRFFVTSLVAFVPFVFSPGILFRQSLRS